MPETVTTNRGRDDRLDAFAYAMEGLKVQKARNLRKHKIRMFVLALTAVILGGVIAWLIKQ